MIPKIPSNDCTVLLLDPSLIILLVGARTREDDFLGFAIRDKRFIDERTAIVSVDPNYRKWESFAKQFHRFNDQ